MTDVEKNEKRVGRPIIPVIARFFAAGGKKVHF